jgi:hypothetical protein
MRSLPCRSLSTRRYGNSVISPLGLVWLLLLLRRCNGIIFISLYHHLAVNRVNGDRFDVKSRLTHGTNGALDLCLCNRSRLGHLRNLGYEGATPSFLAEFLTSSIHAVDFREGHDSHVARRRGTARQVESNTFID